jgi:hypothetical protein
VGGLVQYGGYIYQKLNTWATPAKPPSQDNFGWQRLFMWEETTAPMHFTAGSYPAGLIFLHNGEYYGTHAQTEWHMQNPADPHLGNAIAGYRLIEPWNDTQEYSIFGHETWNLNRRYHTYTVDSVTDEITFWQRSGSIVTISGAGNHPILNPTAWTKNSFSCREQLIVTLQDEILRVWDRQTPFDQGNPIGKPSFFNPTEWVARPLNPVSAQYVFTLEGGTLAIWQRTVQGATTEKPSTGQAWIEIDYIV